MIESSIKIKKGHVFYHLASIEVARSSALSGLHPSDHDVGFLDSVGPHLNLFRTILDIEIALMNGLGDEISSIYGLDYKLAVIAIKSDDNILNGKISPFNYGSSFNCGQVLGFFEECDISDYLTLEHRGEAAFN